MQMKKDANGNFQKLSGEEEKEEKVGIRIRRSFGELKINIYVSF